MDSTDLKDKIVIDPTDNPSVAELFSDKQPGDKVSGTFSALVDEAGEKVITLSIKKIAFNKEGDAAEEAEETPEEEGAEGDAGEAKESAAVSIYKNKAGVPVQDDE